MVIVSTGDSGHW